MTIPGNALMTCQMMVMEDDATRPTRYQPQQRPDKNRCCAISLPHSSAHVCVYEISPVSMVKRLEACAVLFRKN